MRGNVITAIVFFLFFIALMVVGFKDHKDNPECYLLNRTYSNIESKFINPDIINTALTGNNTEIIPECYILRQNIIGYIRAVMLGILTWLAVSFLWNNRAKLKEI